MLPASQGLIIIKKYFKPFVLFDRSGIYNIILEITTMLRVGFTKYYIFIYN